MRIYSVGKKIERRKRKVRGLISDGKKIKTCKRDIIRRKNMEKSLTRSFF